MSRFNIAAQAVTILFTAVSAAHGQATQAPLMAISGATGTSMDGSATFQAALDVPPGAAGTQPALQLNYASGDAGNPYLATGWSLFRYPFLHCPHAPGKFCVGKDSVVAAKGKYGADGTEYRAMDDRFERMVSHGGHAGEPDWFERTTRTGTETTEYGNTPDSREIDPATGKVRAWHVNRVRDAAGNYVTYSYTSDPATGRLYPARIDYTGNKGAQLSPFASVQFSYDKLDGMQKLSHIKTFAGSRLVTDYRLDYAQNAEAGAALLTKLSRCDADGACLAATTIKWRIFHPKDSKQPLPLVSEIENGAGFVNWLDYDSPPGLPAKAAAALKAAYPAEIVSSIAYTDHSGGQDRNSYTFSGQPLLAHDGSFDGFTRRQTTDQEDGVVRTTLRSADPATLGATLSETTSIGTVETHGETYSYGHRPTVNSATFHFVTQAVTANRDLEGRLLLEETARYGVDEFGNVTSIVQTRGDGWNKTTLQKYLNDTAHWHLGRMTQIDVRFKNADGEVHRNSSFQYDPESGLLTQEVVEPDAPQYRLQTDYRYDAFGHRISETVGGADIETSSASAQYDDKGVFMLQQQAAHDPATGKSTVTADGIKIVYDGFGRIIQQDVGDKKRTVRYAYCKSLDDKGEDCPPLATTVTVTVYPGPTPSAIMSYFGPTGLYVGSASATTGRPSFEQREYDRRQHLTQICVLSPGAEKPVCASSKYDVSGRLISVTDTKGHEIHYDYDGLTTHMTDASGVTTTTIADASGKILKMVKGDDSVAYVRDPLGFDTEVHFSDGRWIKKAYDMRGNLVQYRSGKDDKEIVSVERRFNVLNELLSVRDAAGKTQTFEPQPGLVRFLSPNTDYVPLPPAKP